MSRARTYSRAAAVRFHLDLAAVMAGLAAVLALAAVAVPDARA